MENNPKQYILGLDLGIASIGWAVYQEAHNDKEYGSIIDCGVRIFDAAEHPKDKSSLSLQRRQARGMRRTIRRKAYRISCVRKHLINCHLISEQELQYLFAPIKKNKSLLSSKNAPFIAVYEQNYNDIKDEILQYQQSAQQQMAQYGLDENSYNGIYDVYALRYSALNHKLSNQHLAQILIHLAKHRGFKSNRKDLMQNNGTKSDKSTEKQSVNASLSENQQKLAQYKTIGEMLYKLRFTQAENVAPINDNTIHKNTTNLQVNIRNSSYRTDNSYHHMFHRENQNGFTEKNIKQEARLILERQQELGNERITNDFIEKYLKILTQQKSFDWKGNIQDKVGYCLLELQNNNKQLRASKACFSSEKFIALSFLNNIEIYNSNTDHQNDPIRKLSANEIQDILQEAMIKTELSFYHIRNIINLGDHETFHNFVKYEKDEDFSKTEKALKPNQLKFKSYKQLKKAITQECAKQAEHIWNILITNDQLLDEIFVICTYCKENNKLEVELDKLLINNVQYNTLLSIDQVNALKTAIVNQGISFESNINLSLTALYKIIPQLEKGMTYDKACVEAGYLHSTRNLRKSKFLPPIWGRTKADEAKYGADVCLSLDVLEQEMTNPVVKRAISQVRKVINAIIRKYGTPYQINIELGRDLGNSVKKRGQIEKQQKENATKNKQYRAEFEIEINKHQMQYNIKPSDGLKYKLWKEQKGHCIYSDEYIQFEDLRATENAVQVDHIIPYSRSYDDSYNNKVLCKIKHNQNKKSQLAYEYMASYFSDHDLRRFEKKCLDLYGKDSKKYKNLMRKNLDDKKSNEFIERNLNDSRYIATFCMNYIKNFLEFAKDDKEDINQHRSDDSKTINNREKVHCITGRITDYLRRHWHLHNLHTEVVQEKLKLELHTKSDDKKNRDNDLHHAVDACVISVFTPRLREKITKFAQEQEDKGEKEWRHLGYFTQPIPEFRNHVKEKLKQVFVSRMPKHAVGGAVHDETIRSSKYCEKNIVSFENAQGLIEKPFSTLRKPLESSGICWDSTKQEIINLCPTYKKHNKNLYEAIKNWLITNSIVDLKANTLDKALKNAVRDHKLYAPLKEKRHSLDNNSNIIVPLIKSVKTYTVQKSGINIRDGIADRATIIRIDIFSKQGKNYIIPIYAQDMVAESLPNEAILPNKDEKIDHSYHFLFSLYSKDLISVTNLNTNNTIMGYYVGVHSGTGAVTVENHDRSKKYEGVGIKLNLQIKKYQINVLGEMNEIKQEKRLCFNQKQLENAQTQGIEVFYNGKSSLTN
jgi:CRISPR-associated endonuclease Csn1